MAADCTWQGASGSKAWSTAGNWDGGVPLATETAYIMHGTSDIDSGLDQSAVDTLTIHTGEDFTGTIGTPSSPLKTGATTKILINSPRASTINLFPASLTDGYVLDCGSGTYGCHWYDGDITNLYIAGGHVRVGALANPTTIHILGGVTTIESGATITTVNMLGGVVYNSAAMTTINQWGGTWYHNGRTTGAVTTVNEYAGTFFLNSEDFTIGALNVYGGLCDGTQHDYEMTLENSSVWRGGTLKLNMAVIHTNATKLYGGSYSGPGSPSVEIPAGSGQK